MGKTVKEDLSDLLTLGIFGFVILGLAFAGLFVFGGYSEAINTDKFSIYSNLLIGGIIVVALVKLVRAFGNKGGNIDVFIHDTNESVLYSNPLIRKVIDSKLTLMWFSLFLFALSGLIILTDPQSVIGQILGQTAIPTISQQVAPIGNFIFGVEPGSFAETLAFAVLLSLIYSYGLSKIKSSSNTSDGTKWAFIFMLSLVGAVLWMSYHSFAYSNNQLSLLSTFMFGFISAILYLSTLSIIPIYLYHSVGVNLALSLRQTFGSNDIFTTIWIVLVILFLILFIRSLTIRGKK